MSALAGSGLVVAALFALPASAEGVPANQGSALDLLGDVVTPQVTPVTVPAGDITGAVLEYARGWIRLEMRTFNFTDPVKDARWQSDETFALWALETTGDGRPDFMVEYGITSDKELYGDVLRADAGPDDEAVCGADSVSYSSSAMGGFYELRLDPECLGRPASVAYTVGFSFDSGSVPGAGPVGNDIVPDAGFAAAVPVPPETQTVVPNVAPQAVDLPRDPPAATAQPATVPATSARPAPPAPSARTAPITPVPKTPPATRPIHASPPPTERAPVGESSVLPVTALPRTGPSRVVPLSGLGLGVLLVGIGFLVMVSPVPARQLTVSRL